MRKFWGETFEPAEESVKIPSSSPARRIYETHNEKRGRGFIYGGEERVRVFQRVIGDPGAHRVVVDLGGRDGSLACALGFSNDQVIGIDIDAASLKLAKDRYALKVVADVGIGIPVRDHSASLILAGELLEHLPFPQIVVQEAARTMHPDGLFVGSVPNAFKMKNRLVFLGGREFEQDPTHLRRFSVRSLTDILHGHFRTSLVLPCVGRLARLFPKWGSNDLVWVARDPLRG